MYILTSVQRFTTLLCVLVCTDLLISGFIIQLHFNNVSFRTTVTKKQEILKTSTIYACMEKSSVLSVVERPGSCCKQQYLQPLC